MLPCDLTTNAYSRGGERIPALNVSASQDESGAIHISVCNLDPQAPAELECTLDGVEAKRVSGRVLTAGTMTAHNTFEAPHTLQPGTLPNAEIKDGTLHVTLPAKSVVVLEVK